MSKTTSLFHIVFSTRYRLNAIPQSLEKDVYTFVWSCIKEKSSRLNPAVALSDFVRHVKAKSSGWMRTDGRFPMFKGWSEGYFACSISPDVKRNVISYINDQKTHHRVNPFDDEMKSLCHYADLEYDDQDMRL